MYETHESMTPDVLPATRSKFSNSRRPMGLALLLIPAAALAFSLATVSPVSAQNDNGSQQQDQNAPPPQDNGSYNNGGDQGNGNYNGGGNQGNGNYNNGGYGQHSQDQYAPRTLQTQKVPSGSDVRVKLLSDLDSSNMQPGQTLQAVIASDDKSGLPTGTLFVGKVTSVKNATPSTPGALGLQFGLPSSDYQEHNDGEAYTGDIRDDASVQLTGSNAHSKGNTTGALAGAGGLLGLLRKGKIGDTIEGAAIGAVAGTAIDQSMKHSAGDLKLKKGTEITIHLDRPLSLKTVVVPADL